MNEEELNSIQELIDRKITLAEVMGGLTSSDKKFIDLWNYTIELQKENKQLKNDNAVMKAGLIQASNKQLNLYKEVIEEVRKKINEYKKIMEDGIEQGVYYLYLGSLQQRLDELLQILDKVKEND